MESLSLPFETHPFIFISAVAKRTLARVLAFSDRFEDLPRHVRMHFVRSLLFIAICVTVIGLFCIDLVMCAQTPIAQPQTIYEVQQYDRQTMTDVQLSELKDKVKDIEADREKRRKDAEEWRKDTALALQDLHDRQARIEYISTGAGILLGVLQTFNMLKKFRGLETEQVEVKVPGVG
jgi:hypothetical protein